MKIYQLVEYDEDDAREMGDHYASLPSKLFLTFRRAEKYARNSYEELIEEQVREDPQGFKFTEFQLIQEKENGPWIFDGNELGMCYLIYESHTTEVKT